MQPCLTEPDSDAMKKMFTSPRTLLIALSLMAAALTIQSSRPAAAQTRSDQAVLGPGLYVFQTRTISATCGDASRTGFVTSYYAAIDGIPGSREMTMNLLNSEHWPRWAIAVNADGNVVAHAYLDGTAGANRPSAHFELMRQPDKFAGRGIRSYRSGGQQCTITYDALLRRIDRP